MNKVQNVNSQKLQNIVLVSMVFATLFTIVFTNGVLTNFFINKKYYDYGVSLFIGNSPDKDLYIYILAITSSVFFITSLWLLSKILIFRKLDLFSFENKKISIFFISVFLFFTPFYAHTEIPYVYMIVFLTMFLISIYFNENKNITYVTNSFLILILSIILFYHIPKVTVLVDIFYASGKPKTIIGLFCALVISIFFITFNLFKSASVRHKILVSFIFVLIFFIGINEYRTTWGIDVFHEAEGVLNGHFLFNAQYAFYENFFPIHGLFRNSIPAYISTFFSDNNLYLVRVVTTFYSSFFILLVTMLIYRFSNIFISIGFFILNYTYPLLDPLDLSPFLIISFLLLSVANKESKYLYYLTGIFLGLDSIYSYEFMIFYLLAFSFIASVYFYKNNSKKTYTRDIIFGFLFIWLIIAVYLNTRLPSLFSYMIELLKMSPNLLDRPIDFPKKESFIFLIIYVILPFFVFLHLLQASKYVFLEKTNKFGFILAIFSLVSLMYFTRALNRSDDGHIIQGLYISIPIFIAFFVFYSTRNRQFFTTFVSVIVVFQIYNQFMQNKEFFSFLKNSALYDRRMTKDQIPLGGSFGKAYVPLISLDSVISSSEMNGLMMLKSNGYTVFDYTNQPYLVYGILGYNLTHADIYTIFTNTMTQQKNIISSLTENKKAVILFTANHWSETLDNNYQEYRLPIVSKYIAITYPYKYILGRFVVLSQENLSFYNDQKSRNNDKLTTQYNLGFAPARMTFYKEECISRRIQVDLNKNGIFQISKSFFDALILKATNITDDSDIKLTFRHDDLVIFTISFKPKNGFEENFIRFSNLLIYNQNNVNNIKIEVKGCDLKKIELLKLGSNV